MLSIGMLFRGLYAPRASVRQVLDLGLDGRGGLLILLTSWAFNGALSNLVYVVFPTLVPKEIADQGLIESLGTSLAVMVIVYYITSGLAFVIGQKFGGIGNFTQICVAMGWSNLVISLLTPLLTLLAGLISVYQMPSLSLMFLGMIALTFWIIASIIAETHGFKSTFKTAMACLGVLFVLSLIMIIPLQMLGILPTN